MRCFSLLSLQLQECGDWRALRVEAERAAKAVRQLGSLLFEMEV